MIPIINFNQNKTQGKLCDRLTHREFHLSWKLSILVNLNSVLYRYREEKMARKFHQEKVKIINTGGPLKEEEEGWKKLERESMKD